MALGDYFCPDCGTTNPHDHSFSCPRGSTYKMHIAMARERSEEFSKEKEARWKATHFCSHCGKDFEEGEPWKVSEATGKKYHKKCFKYRRE